MNNFNLYPHSEKWFSWEEVNSCFWPGKGNLSCKVNPELSSVISMSGIYLIGWGEKKGIPTPNSPIVKYIGMTENFKNRIGQFASSSGLHYDDRYDGHSAAWRWPSGKSEQMVIAFFELPKNQEKHLRIGLLHWQEALAIHEYYKKYGVIPPLNEGFGEISL